jgi:hypothetical protein
VEVQAGLETCWSQTHYIGFVSLLTRIVVHKAEAKLRKLELCYGTNVLVQIAEVKFMKLELSKESYCLVFEAKVMLGKVMF